MGNKIKKELKKIEIPEELHQRSKLGVAKAKLELQQMTGQYRAKNGGHKIKKRLIAAAASLAIIGTSWAFGRPYIADAGQTLIDQIFSSNEEIKKVDPIASDEDFQEIEQHLQLAEQVLTTQEFRRYSELLKKMIGYAQRTIVMENGIKTQNLNLLTDEEQKKFEQIQNEVQNYEKIISKKTNPTLEEAKKIAKYPINRPIFVPAGYVLESEKTKTEDRSPDENPVVQMQYRKGEFGFRVIISPSIEGADDEITKLAFEHIEPNSYKGYEIDYAYSDDTNVSGMRLNIPKNNDHEPYKILIVADILSKEDMEKILLSMVQQ